MISFCIMQPGIAVAQHPSTSKHNDRYDLVANINKVQADRRNIDNVRKDIEETTRALSEHDARRQAFVDRLSMLNKILEAK